MEEKVIERGRSSSGWVSHLLFKETCREREKRESRLRNSDKKKKKRGIRRKEKIEDRKCKNLPIHALRFSLIYIGIYA